MAIRKAETEIAHRESSMFCFLMAENKSLSTKLIKMDLNLKLDTKVKRMAKDMVLVDQEAMVEIMDTQVADLTEMEPEVIMFIYQAGEVMGLTSPMVNETYIHLHKFFAGTTFEFNFIRFLIVNICNIWILSRVSVGKTRWWQWRLQKRK